MGTWISIKQIHALLLEQLRGDVLSPFLAANKGNCQVRRTLTL